MDEKKKHWQYESVKKSKDKYQKANTIQFPIRLNFNTDAEIIEKLQSVDNKQGYIKKLILDDINKAR